LSEKDGELKADLVEPACIDLSGVFSAERLKIIFSRTEGSPKKGSIKSAEGPEMRVREASVGV